MDDQLDPAHDSFHFKPRLPKPKTPFESLILSLKLMPEDILSSDWSAWAKAIEAVAPRERAVLDERHGLRGGGKLTLQEIGRRLGITREWVRQLQERGHRQLRKRAVEAGLIDQRAPNRLSYLSRTPYWPPGTTRGAPLKREPVRPRPLGILPPAS